MVIVILIMMFIYYDVLDIKFRRSRILWMDSFIKGKYCYFLFLFEDLKYI